MRILVINGGSSSFKCRLDDISSEPPVEPPKPLWESHLDVNDGVGQALETALRSAPGPIDVVGHRIVHGGPHYREATVLTPEVRRVIFEETDVAPDHNAFELAAIKTVENLLGTRVPQVAAFDTGFHATLPPEAYVYPGPYEWLARGIRRYGFHGISHQYASRRAAQILGRESLRLITCHLGNGASLAAIRDGRSIDTTMGFTPLEGLMMGTRCGSIDPAILIYLQRHHGYTADQLDRVLNKESGLLGVSGISFDMREILAAMNQGNERGKLAFDVYAHSLCRGIGQMLGSLGGVDALVFTAGIGENASALREIAAKRFAFLNASILVIHAEEEWAIARECYRITR